MEVVEGCGECKRLAEAYEAATITWFRLEGNLRIAEYGRDKAAAEKLAAELGEKTRHRRELRDAMNKHRTDAHPGESVLKAGCAPC